jgi:tRNA dimethylallyltransferase
LNAAKGRLLVLCGPTASGKSALAQELAEAAKIQLISADSMQVYRGMDIGTAKPKSPWKERTELLDVADPGEGFSAGRFSRLASAACAKAWAAGLTPCLVGGTGLYIEALLMGIAEIPQVPWELRLKVGEMGAEERVDELKRLDPKSAESIALENPRRVGRALEVFLATGKGLRDWQEEGRKGALEAGEVLKLALDPGREALASRIRGRVQEALREGWARECQALAGAFSPEALRATGAIGYAEILEGGDKLEERIALRTSQYARRQRSWFRRDPAIYWHASAEGAKKQALEFLGI